MAPKTPKNKNLTKATNLQQTPKDAAGTAINYAEAQKDEIEVLKAIYMDDFRELASQTAWKQVTDHKFELTLRSFSDLKSYVTLSVQLTATYPKSAPLLDISGLQHYHERTQQRIRNTIKNRPKQLLGEVMIHALAEEIQQALEDAVQARQSGTLPSLEDERASAEETAAAIAKEAEESQARREQAARSEEERVLKHMLEAEVSRNEQKRKSLNSKDQNKGLAADSGPPTIAFDTPGELRIGSDIESFSHVQLLNDIGESSSRTIYLGKPEFKKSELKAPLVVVKSVRLQKSRPEIVDLETTLTAVRALRHSGLLNVLAYRIEKLQDLRSELVLCHEYANRGSLQDMLSLGTVHIDTSRRFTIELLEALDYVHSKGLFHGNICAQTIFINSNPLPSLKIADLGYTSITDHLAAPTKWRAPDGDIPSASVQRKSDIWQLGVVAVQMFLGLEMITEYSSAQTLINKHDLADSFADFLSSAFTLDWKKRPSAFDLLPSEFLRTNQPIMDEPPRALSMRPRTRSNTEHYSPVPKHRSRRNSSSFGLDTAITSRYATDFTEMGRLGKGGYGEVVKARNKLDGGVFAIKKITQAPQLLGAVISEVMLLNRLNHPYVVRYYSTWVEENASVVEDSSAAETATETATGTGKTGETEESEEFDGPRIDFGYQSTGGLDFVSSTGHPQIEFGEDSDDSAEDSEDDAASPVRRQGSAIASTESSGAAGVGLRRTRSDSKRAPSTLYIQMELCERRTLRDIVRKEIPSDEVWRYVRQITEGLAHIHGHGIIHRDLKPDNVFIDSAGNPKIGDFGLATTAQQTTASSSASAHGGDMTGNVGTALYVAPELTVHGNSTYTDKVDMYSLGIMFYEMCEHFETGSQRVTELLRIREKNHVLDPSYRAGGGKEAQGKLITCLISHKPSERPSSAELLRGDILPADLKDETIRQALASLSDPKSPYHQKLMSALFSHDAGSNSDRVKALAWDAKAALSNGDASRLRLRDTAKQTLEAVFRRHGAEEIRRPAIFPKSSYNQQPEVVQLLDASGNLLQLPYDLVVPHARELAKHASPVRCSYTFGTAYRDKARIGGGPPQESQEVDFDISSNDPDNRARDDAEVLKAMDEVFSEMPLLETTVAFHINHAHVLDATLQFCRIPTAQQQQVKEIISRLGSGKHSWNVIRVELRKFGLSDTTLDDLQLFDFRESLEKASARLRGFITTGKPRHILESGLSHLTELVRYTESFGVHKKMHLSPLGSVNSHCYEGGMLFQCVLERKGSHMVVAAGGRYDSLISAYQPPATSRLASSSGAVGVSIGLEPIINIMARAYESRSGKKTYLRETVDVDSLISKRCKVLISAGDSEALQHVAIKLLASLWATDISAELSHERSHAATDYTWTVALKHEAATTVRVTEVGTENEEDVPVASLTSYLQQELRDRRRTAPKTPSLLRHASSQEVERKSNNVQVLMAGHGSKKSNKYQIVAAAAERWSKKLDEAKAAPILAVETTDKVLDLIRQTRLSDAESWRKAAQSVQLGEKKYVEDVQRQLDRWRSEWEKGDGMREACVYNFRTQYCIYYDLGL